MKYIELFKNGFDSTIDEKIKPENWPYVGYSPSEGLRFTIVSKEDGYTLIALKKVDISNISYEEVDLGLSSGLKWANKNIGAQTIEDYGTYFSWGNTDGYTVSGTKFLTVDETCQLISSVTGETVTTKEELESMLSEIGLTVDNLYVVDGYSFDETTYASTSGGQFTGETLDTEHDAATANMGNEWHMPTREETDELVNGTDQYGIKEDGTEVPRLEMTSEDTYIGMKFVSKAEGNNNSIFIPSAGICFGPLVDDKGSCYVWTSSVVGNKLARSLFVNRYGNVFGAYSTTRYYGQPVRGVHA